MSTPKIDISLLQSVKNYADSFGVSASYIYKLAKDGKMNLFEIDGVKFVRVDIYATIPVANRRK